MLYKIIIYGLLLICIANNRVIKTTINNNDVTLHENISKLYIDFDTGMHLGFSQERYNNLLAKKNQKDYMPLLKELYSKNNFLIKLKNFNKNNTTKIPKIIHQIWLGGDLPDLYKKNQQTWLSLHPEWEYKLWTDENIKNLKLINQDAFNKADTYYKKRTILRYELLNQFGGLYVNTDIECLKNFDILNCLYEFYVGIATINRLTLVNNGLIGATPHHPLIKACINTIKEPEYLKKIGKHGVYHFCDIILTACINDPSINLENVAILPPPYLYPLAGTINKNNLKTPISFSICYWDKNQPY